MTMYRAVITTHQRRPLIGRRVTNAVTRQDIRVRHTPVEGVCPCDRQEWPCDAIIVLDDLEATEAAFRLAARFGD